MLNAKFMHLTFEYSQPHTVPFRAGQYVSLAVDAEGHRRSYSICSSPNIEHGFELLIDVTPQGLGTKYLQSIPLGQVVSALVPMGMFTVQEDARQFPLVFLATGSGVAPFRSMIMNELQVRQNRQPMILYWGLRYVEELFWQDEFTELMESFPNFQFHPVISRPLQQWPLCRGRVTDCLQIHDIIPTAHYYLCGNAPMIADVLQFLDAQQVTAERIHREKFY